MMMMMMMGDVLWWMMMKVDLEEEEKTYVKVIGWWNTVCGIEKEEEGNKVEEAIAKM